MERLMGRLHGLAKAGFAHIVGTFPLVVRETRNVALETYRAGADWAPESA
jgi:hypothetical protein